MKASHPIFRLRGFSLLELLMVIVVIAVLSSLVVVAITNVGGAGKLTTAGNQVVDVLNNTRQYAQSKNALAMVAVVSSGDSAGRVLGSFAFSATNGTSGTWSQIDRWRTLPDGIKINLDQSTNLFRDPSAMAPTSVAVPSFQRAGASVNCLAATFLPDGRLLAGSSQSPVALLHSTTGSTNNFYKIIVNQATGIPAIRRP